MWKITSLFTQISSNVLQNSKIQLQRNVLSKSAVGSSRLLFFLSVSLILNPSLLTFYPSYHPLSMHPTQSICQAASALKQCTNHCRRSVAHTSSPPVVQWDWLLLRPPGVFRQQPDPRTTVWLPGAKSSNDRTLPLKQSQGHRGPERTAKTRALRGDGGGVTISVLFRSTLRAIYLPVVHGNHPI